MFIKSACKLSIYNKFYSHSIVAGGFPEMS